MDFIFQFSLSRIKANERLPEYTLLTLLPVPYVMISKLANISLEFMERLTVFNLTEGLGK